MILRFVIVSVFIYNLYMFESLLTVLENKEFITNIKFGVFVPPLFLLFLCEYVFKFYIFPDFLPFLNVDTYVNCFNTFMFLKNILIVLCISWLTLIFLQVVNDYIFEKHQSHVGEKFSIYDLCIHRARVFVEKAIVVSVTFVEVLLCLKNQKEIIECNSLFFGVLFCFCALFIGLSFVGKSISIYNRSTTGSIKASNNKTYNRKNSS